jgi:predicted RNase H-like HicB family nuclease
MTSLTEFKIALTEIVVPDERTSQFSAFFAEFPEAIACGDTQDEAKNNLHMLIQVMLNDRKMEVMNSYVDNQKYFSNPINMIMA